MKISNIPNNVAPVFRTNAQELIDTAGKLEGGSAKRQALILGYITPCRGIGASPFRYKQKAT